MLATSAKLATSRSGWDFAGLIQSVDGRLATNTQHGLHA